MSVKNIIVIDGIGRARKRIQDALGLWTPRLSGCNWAVEINERREKGHQWAREKSDNLEKFLLHTWDVKTDGCPVIRATVPFLSCLEGPEVWIVWVFDEGELEKTSFLRWCMRSDFGSLAAWVIRDHDWPGTNHYENAKRAADMPNWGEQYRSIQLQHKQRIMNILWWSLWEEQDCYTLQIQLRAEIRYSLKRNLSHLLYLHVFSEHNKPRADTHLSIQQHCKAKLSVNPQSL